MISIAIFLPISRAVINTIYCRLLSGSPTRPSFLSLGCWINILSLSPSLPSFDLPSKRHAQDESVGIGLTFLSVGIRIVRRSERGLSGEMSSHDHSANACASFFFQHALAPDDWFGGRKGEIRIFFSSVSLLVRLAPSPLPLLIILIWIPNLILSLPSTMCISRLAIFFFFSFFRLFLPLLSICIRLALDMPNKKKLDALILWLLGFRNISSSVRCIWDENSKHVQAEEKRSTDLRLELEEWRNRRF